VLFIGEAPGASEDSLGTPFIGPAGKLLDEIIARASYRMSLRIAFTNLIGCIPKEDGQKVTEPPEYAVKACKERLRELILIARPKICILVGKHAEKHRPVVGPEWPMTFYGVQHPAFILRASIDQKGLLVQRATVILHEAFKSLGEM